MIPIKLKNNLGQTGLQVSPIIFGSSALGNLYVELADEVKLEIISEWFRNVEKPVVIDIAGKYGAGLALEVLGKGLKALNISPDDVLISNKLAWMRSPLLTPEPTFEPGVWKNLKSDAKQNISYKGIVECWEQGNELLGGNYSPQIVSVHDPDEYVNAAKNPDERKELYSHILEAYKALLELKSKGLVKAVGVGAKDWTIIREIAADIDLDWVMFANSLTIMNHPPELLNFFEELNNKGIGIINSAVFHAGFLIGGEFFDYVKIKPDSEKNRKIFNWRDNFFTLCKQYDINPAVACIAFAKTVPGVVSIALNTSKPGRVKDNVKAVATEVCPEFWNSMLEQGLIDKNFPYI